MLNNASCFQLRTITTTGHVLELTEQEAIRSEPVLLLSSGAELFGPPNKTLAELRIRTGVNFIKVLRLYFTRVAIVCLTGVNFIKVLHL